MFLTPRFRGKTRRLLAIYEAFLDDPHLDHTRKGLHPQQIARRTGLSMMDVAARLDATPELFVRLAKRDGLTRYALTSVTAASTPAQIEALVIRSARGETWVIYAAGAMLVLAFIIVVILMGPAV